MQTVLLAASGDLRLSANQVCWEAQHKLESQLTEILNSRGISVHRIHDYDPTKKHGFLDSQRAGLDAFSRVDPSLPIIIVEAVWQYSHHILPGLLKHEGPILTLANWSGQWPGLVGMLNLNGGLTKAGKPYSTLWSENFDDELFERGLNEWIESQTVTHDLSHVRQFESDSHPALVSVVDEIERHFRRSGVILGVFDEGCMGMYNAIIPDELLFPMGVYKERLSQSALAYAMTQVTDEEADEVYNFIVSRGFKFHFGENDSTDLTKQQVMQQCRMYVAACRIGDEFGCDAIGIQYQQGLKDVTPASDLVEGLLNNTERPPVKRHDGSIIKDGQPYTHFNEVDECAGLDGIITQMVHQALGQPVENTLHDLRWGDWDQSGTTDEYVWVFEISGAAPPAHHIGGYGGSYGMRQPAMYFRLGGSTCAGIARPGDIVWSRIYVEKDKLHMDIGRASVIELPAEETQRRLDATTPQWPIMHAVLHGVHRDQMMAKHKSNHIQVVYAHTSDDADLAMLAKASLAQRLGIHVNLCGV